MTRGSAQWGTGTAPRGRLQILATAALALAIVLAAMAGLAAPASAGRGAVFVPDALVQSAQAQPDQTFRVIVQGARSERSSVLVERVGGKLGRPLGQRSGDSRQWFDGLSDQFDSINGVAVKVTGKELEKLLATSGVTAVSLDAPVHLAGNGNTQKWVEAVGAKWYWGSPYAHEFSPNPPTIAVIDSGVQSITGDLAGRQYNQVNLAGFTGNTYGSDGYGHGTMVAGIAAGASRAHGGVAPAARILPIDVVDDSGHAFTSDVIRACDWLLRSKDAYNIEVANLSLSADGLSSFRFDPLDKAVERLWFAGITVVVSAGNYGTGDTPSGVPLAPANDPFVITVGAADVNGTPSPSDDFAAPWTAWGYTADGFAKPEVGAPGRYMIGPIPGLRSTLGAAGGQDKKLVPQGYLQLSGTSFAAPVVSGIAAALLLAHPEWTPDQVKGAIMAGATTLASNAQWQLGVGEVNLQKSIALATPPNPNAALRQFVVADPAGGSLPVFDDAAWSSAAQASASWLSASWSSAAWSSASWSSASWSSASWSSASWSSASWSSASWSSASSVDASWANNADGDGNGDG